VTLYCFDGRTPMMTLVPQGGLCNRMRAMNSAFAFAAQVPIGLEIVWCKDAMLNCSLSELFTLRSETCRVTEFDINTRAGRFAFASRRWLCRAKKKIWIDQGNLFDLDMFDEKFLQGIKLTGCYLETYSSFFYNPSPFSNLNLTKEIQGTVDTYSILLSNAVGIHIRRTDNESSILNSPSRMFQEAMMKEMDLDPNVIFYLATDSPEEEVFFKEVFPSNIVCHKKTSYDRNDPKAIRDALIDLYCLANCRKLIGSYWSSFTDTASEIRGIEKQVIDNREESS